MLSSIEARIAAELSAKPEQIIAAIALLDEGATVPFIARYRKEVTGGLDDTQLRTLEERLGYLRELEDRRKQILASIEDQKKLTPELRASIENAETKQRLEDLYLPYKPKRRTKAQIAREAGLEPLASIGKKYAAGQKNRMIKVPSTEAGLASLEELAAAGVTLNVTLCFTERQYTVARDAIWRGAQRRKDGLDSFKSVYSIFISRVDVYTEKHVPELSDEAQGLVGVVNAKQMYRVNQNFWKDKKLRLEQEIIFASTGKKLPWQEPDYYVEQLVGDDIQTNPPETNEFIEKSPKRYRRTIDEMVPPAVVEEIKQKVDVPKMERVLMEEGLKKFADPQKALQKQIAQRRAALASSR